MVTRTAIGDGGGNTYWQAGGGTQLRLRDRDLWLRAEGNAARNMDLAHALYVPRESFVFGVNGQMSRLDDDRVQRQPGSGAALCDRRQPLGDAARSCGVTHTLPTGSVFLAERSTTGSLGSEPRNGTISGLGVRRLERERRAGSGENTLEGIPLTLGAGHTFHRTTTDSSRF